MVGRTSEKTISRRLDRPTRREMLCDVLFFSLSSWAVALIIFAVVASVTGAGVLLGRHLREHHETLREPFGVLQGALLGVVGLILAFGLSLAVGRYEDRRAAVVSEANAIGTTYLRGQLLAEPVRTRSLAGEQIAPGISVPTRMRGGFAHGAPPRGSFGA